MPRGVRPGSREMRRSDKKDEKATPEAIYQYLMDHREEIMAAAKEKAKELIAEREKQERRKPK